MSIFLLVSGNLSCVKHYHSCFLSYLTRVWSYRRLCLAIDKPYGGPSVPFEGARAKSSSHKFT